MSLFGVLAFPADFKTALALALAGHVLDQGAWLPRTFLLTFFSGVKDAILPFLKVFRTKILPMCPTVLHAKIDVDVERKRTSQEKLCCQAVKYRRE